MKNLSFYSLSLLLLVLAGTLFESCKRKFDEPPVDEYPALTANVTIAQLKATHTIGTNPTIVADTSWIIEGVVIADDKSGNFYKSLIIQDSTGGIELRLDASSLYVNYPIGRKIWVKVGGGTNAPLYVGDYSGKHQIVASAASAALADVLIAEYVFRGPLDQFVTPAVRTITQLTDADVNTLIKLEAVEFTAADMTKTYADAIGKFSVNLNLTDCNNNLILLRSSGYSDFAAQNVPDSNGTIVAVYSVFGTDKQLFIRDPSDLSMSTNNRCTAGGGGGGGGTLMNIADVRAVYTGTTTTAPADKKIRGYVISDVANGNWLDKNLAIQDATGGITVRFAAAHGFSVGDELEITISGVELSEYNSLLQLNNVPTANAVLISSGNTVTPNVATIADITANFEAWESTLVQITGATITGGSTYSGNKTVSDGTGTITLYTSSFASFATNTVPSGTVDVVAVISQYFSAQLLMRDANDVTGGQQIVYDLNEGFDAATVNSPIALANWTTVAQTGAEVWEGRSFSGNFYARASAFGANPANVVTWLITPGMNLSQNKFLSFDSECAFWVHDGLSVWISTNFNGSNVATANWQQLTATTATSTDGNYVWVNSGNIDLSAYTGSTVYIGFKYTGSDPSNTTNYDIDNVKIWNQ